MAASILAFAGSARSGSLNRRVVQFAAEAASEAGAQVKVVNLADYEMPLYHGDLEAADGLPAGARAFRADLAASAGFLVSSPEYNSAITALLKNSIDWASRPVEGEGSPFAGKVAGLLAASPGALGGIRGLPIVRQIFTSLGVHVIPQQAAVGQAGKVIGEDGSALDERSAKRISGVSTALVDFLNKHG